MRLDGGQLDQIVGQLCEIEELAERLARWTSPVDAPWATLATVSPKMVSSPHVVVQLSLSHAFAVLQRFLPATFAITRMQQYLSCTNRPGENVKLTLNRRRAVVAHSLYNTEAKMQHSIFGQLHALLGKRKASTLFMTGKKLWTVVFAGEGADDVGGPYRESIAELCRELMGDGVLPLFSRVPSNQTSDGSERFIVARSPPSFVSRNMYLFLGRLMGGCLRSGEPLALSLPSFFWKALLGRSVAMSDLAHIDSGMLTALEYLLPYCPGGSLEGDSSSLSSVYEGAFEVPLLSSDDDGTAAVGEESGSSKMVSLVTNGHAVEVSHDNVGAYCQLVLQHRLLVDGRLAYDAIREGFLQIVPPAAIRFLKWFELEQLVCGLPDFSVPELLQHARFEGLDATDPLVGYLRQTLLEFTPHERALFVRFISGRERLPFGMRLKIILSTSQSSMQQQQQQQQSQGVRPQRRLDAPQPPRQQQSPIDPNAPSSASMTTTTVTGHSTSASTVAPPTTTVESSNRRSSTGAHRPSRASGTSPLRESSEGAVVDDDHLPYASTCFFWLSIPRYSSQAVLASKLRIAITQCVDIDADFRLRAEDQEQEQQNPTVVVRGGDEENEDEEFEDYHHLL